MIRLKRKIFTPGIHTDSSGFTRDYPVQELGAMVDAYNEFGYPVPIIAGHRETPLGAEVVEGVPFYGRIERLDLDEQGNVLATFYKMSDAFLGWLNRDAVEFSVDFIAPQHPANPKKGNLFLRNLAMVDSPALKSAPQDAFAFSECICCTSPKDNDLIGEVNMSEKTTAGVPSQAPQSEQVEQPNQQQHPSFQQPQTLQPVMYGYGVLPQTTQLPPAQYPPLVQQMGTPTQQWPVGQPYQFAQLPPAQGHPLGQQIPLPLAQPSQQSVPQQIQTATHQFQQPQVPSYDPFAVEDTQFCEKLMNEGKLTPVQANLASFILRHVDTQPRFQFQEPRTGQQVQVGMRDVLKDFLRLLPKQVEYGVYTPPSEGRGQYSDSSRYDPATDAQVEARLKEYS